MSHRRIPNPYAYLPDKLENFEKVKKTVDAFTFGWYISIPIDLLRMIEGYEIV